MNRVAAAARSRKWGNGKNRKRIEKTTYVETETITTTDGGEIEVRLIAQGGRLGSGEVAPQDQSNTAPTLVECQRKRLSPYDCVRQGWPRVDDLGLLPGFAPVPRL